MADWAQEHAVMWRGSAHRVSLPDLLRLRAAGWVASSPDEPDFHFGVVHAALTYDSPSAAARQLDEEATRRRQRYWASRGPGPTRGKAKKDEAARTKTALAREAASARRRRHAA